MNEFFSEFFRLPRLERTTQHLKRRLSLDALAADELQYAAVGKFAIAPLRAPVETPHFLQMIPQPRDHDVAVVYGTHKLDQILNLLQAFVEGRFEPILEELHHVPQRLGLDSHFMKLPGPTGGIH